MSRGERKAGLCVENHFSIYSAVAFHLKKATGHGHFQSVGHFSSVSVSDPRILMFSDRISTCLSKVSFIPFLLSQTCKVYSNVARQDYQLYLVLAWANI